MSAVTRKEIIQQVLLRMDEICPAEDINISEGQLIDGLLNDALLQFLRIANVDTLYNESQTANVVAEDGQSVFGTFPVPADFVRFVACSSSGWKRTLHEGDLLTTSSGVWEMAHMKFREPSPGKPMIAILPKDSGKNVFSIAPYSEGDTVKVRYVAELTPEKFANGGNNTEVDSKAQSLWFAYLWYVAYLTLQTMGQADTSALALQHMQSYQAIPNGMPAPAPQA